LTALIDGTNGVTTPNVLTSSSGVALTLQSGGTTAITVDTSQNVGIGTTSPAYKLQVSNTSAYGQFALQGNSANGGIINFYDSASVVTSRILGFGSTSGSPDNYALRFDTNGTERMRISGNAPILCLAGGSQAATGTGIAFPATQNPSSDANTLDDYEEGTFTPSIVPDSGSITSQTGSGKYTKVGNVVTVVLYVTLTNVGTASGGMGLTGLPFVSVRASSSGRSFVALVREDAQTGYFYSCNGVTGGTGGYFYTLTTNGPPPYTNNYSYCFSVSYLTT